MSFRRSKWGIIYFVSYIMYWKVRVSLLIRHERDQWFLVPVPSETNFGWGFQSKIFWLRSRSKKKHFGPGPVQKNFWCWSYLKSFGPGPGPGQKKFWSRSRSKKKFWSRSRSKKKFGPGPGTGTTLLISTIDSFYPRTERPPVTFSQRPRLYSNWKIKWRYSDVWFKLSSQENLHSLL